MWSPIEFTIILWMQWDKIRYFEWNGNENPCEPFWNGHTTGCHFQITNELLIDRKVKSWPNFPINMGMSSMIHLVCDRLKTRDNLKWPKWKCPIFIYYLVGSLLRQSEAKPMKTLRGQTSSRCFIFSFFLSIFVFNHDERNFYRHRTLYCLFFWNDGQSVRLFYNVILVYHEASIVNPISMDVIRSFFRLCHCILIFDGKGIEVFRRKWSTLEKTACHLW